MKNNESYVVMLLVHVWLYHVARVGLIILDKLLIGMV